MSRTAPSVVWERKHRRVLPVCAFIAMLTLCVAGSARADLYVTATESGAMTTVLASGSINLDGLTLGANALLQNSSVFPSRGFLSIAPTRLASAFQFSGTPFYDFGASAILVSGAFGPGSAVLFVGDLGQIYVPRTYQSGSPLSASAIFPTLGFADVDTTPFDVPLPSGDFLHFWHDASFHGPSDDIITSTLTTGVSVPNAAQSILTSAPQTALNTVNNRIFHARSQVGNPRDNGGGVVSSGRSNSNFFNFGQGQGLNLAQALGFEDIPVSAEVADSEASFIIKGLTIETQIASTVAPEAKPWEIYTSGDYHAFDQDNIGAQPGFDSDTFTGTVGAEYRVNEKLNIGLAYSYLDNRAKLGGNSGRVDVEGHLATAYATYFWEDNYVDVLYSRAYFDNSLMRNVPGGVATGTPESMADIVNVNLGKNIDLGNGLVTGPIAGLEYTHGTIDAYTELGPAAAILAYQARSYESMITKLGWQATKTQEVECGRLTLQGSLAWEKENKPESDTVNAALVAFPLLPLPLSTGAHPGTDWLGLGLGASLQTRSGVEVGLNYQSQLFRKDVTSHYVGARVSVKF